MHKQPAAVARTLVLASTSRYRRHLFERLRVPFETAAPGVDEEPYKHRGLSPNDMVRQLAELKSRAVAPHWPSAIIVGGDQCATIDGRLLGKPGTVERTIEQLSSLAGRTHQLVTALCVLDGVTGHCDTMVDVHEMTMRPLDAEQIRRYVELDEPVDCAGSYKLESLGVALFERVSGSDPTAIVGVPLMQLVTMLARCGYDVFRAAR
ncbi:MAG: Maf family protein [Myxococcota bacterium]